MYWVAGVSFMEEAADNSPANLVPRIFSPPYWKARRSWGRGCSAAVPMIPGGCQISKMAPLAEKEVSKIDNQTEKKEQTQQNDSVKREEKAQKMKERLLNAQAQGIEERKAGNASADMSPELKQEMEKFFVWTPPPPPETMGEKLKRKVKQNPIVPIG